ncbi:acetyl-CoA carboxylase [Roseibium sp. MMSF_3544]|uniref:acetyl-CoA carboxylase n=1 Tax=unclassified Roseibium TaxID=2629323 RepID=UPI00273F9B1A|nr:acetyl-CoA carboxylase [Roseibium sp. MMSF_3544]
MAIHEVRAMMPGIFYRKPSPDDPSYKEAGDSVAKGDVIGLIEVMKSFHEVVADADGTITSFQADNEEAIMPGQVLAEIEV